jgi:hypothetical protein
MSNNNDINRHGCYQKLYKNMREKYKINSSSIPDDTDLAEYMSLSGYKLIQIVPRFFSDGTCAGYTYWFEDILE